MVSGRTLKLNELYSREAVHGIFSPETDFTPRAGTWGLHGIVKVPDRDGDFVFFVTYGQSQGDHDFDEGITPDGVLSWQSQPRQSLKDPTVLKLIEHNELVSNIYLFLREEKRADYKYMGRLGYLEHDTSREQPVYFQWQLLDWEDLGSQETVTHSPPTAAQSNQDRPPGLEFTDSLPKKKRSGTSKENFRSRKVPDYSAQDSKNRELGLAGELIVLQAEKANLENAGRSDLAERVLHVSVVEGDGAGYDIKSFSTDGEIKYIEVKTTKGSINTEFFMSPNEIAFSKAKSDSFHLYRLYEVSDDLLSARVYKVLGDVTELFNLEPTGFKLSVK